MNTPAQSSDGQTKIRNAEFIVPTNVMRQKLGVGGIDKEVLKQADNFLKQHPVDFIPIGSGLLNALTQGVESARNDGLDKEPSIEIILYPAAQLKAHGAMFHFPLVTKIADILVNFLETVEAPNKEVFEIIDAHKTALAYVLNNNLKDETCAHGRALQNTLQEACKRYYKLRKAPVEA